MIVIEEIAMSKIIRLDEAETRKALGGTLKVLFTPETANTQFSRCSMGYFSPGEQLAPHIHPESEEVYYVIKVEAQYFLVRS